MEVRSFIEMRRFGEEDPTIPVDDKPLSLISRNPQIYIATERIASALWWDPASHPDRYQLQHTIYFECTLTHQTSI